MGEDAMEPLARLVEGFRLEEVGDGRYRGHNAGGGAGAQGVVFGGLLLGQSVVAAARSQPGKEVKTVHTVFARAGRVDQPLDIAVDTVHAGRTFASVAVTASQGEPACTRSLVLLHAPEPDVIRHGAPMPAVPGPEETPSTEREFAGYRIGVVGGVDVGDPDAVGPAELPVWVRFEGAPDDLTTSQALLAYASDGFLVGTAMRPHRGVGQSQAHQALSTGVVSHTLTFHEPFRASEWLLLAQESPYAGRGRAYGRAHTFAADGRLVASFVQDSMIRQGGASAL
ncbi:MAG TPA: acyl-CoA thioesterase domain-containing protein [Acidimicrobiales bacterium]|nr:acyl-CoA thioesterase domain-containing protein [Acidimicrobiales bacterium]